MRPREFADKYPSAWVIGTDVADKTAPCSVPPNLEIFIEDCTERWSFHGLEFDFMHARGLIGAIKDWKALFTQAYRCLVPEQWFETIEPLFRFENESHVISVGSPLRRCESLFIPVGEWPQESLSRSTGLSMRAALESDIEGAFNSLARDLKWPEDDCILLASEFRKERRRNDLQLSVPYKAVRGKKPL
ncbi:methyltransferase domain-containing protein [Colletotrichum incanum]|nr:methyltransferase domain-containing protein [Colletotrichum incanum]